MLVYLLWPEVPEEQGRRNLRQLLIAVTRLPFTEALVSEEARLVWPVETDVAQFRSALTQRDGARATQLYGGELLQGFSVAGLAEFGLWLEEERQELAALRREATLKYAHDLNVAGKSQRAADVLARTHHADRFDEEVLRALLESLYAGDQWGRASEVYGAFRHYLKGEVGGEPEPATLRRAERLRHVKADVLEAEAAGGAASATADQEIKTDSGGQPNRRRPFGPVPERLVGPLESSRARFFKGRVVPLRQLRHATRHEDIRLIQVGGRGGIGKTSLVTKFLLELSQEPPAVSSFDAFIYVSLREAGARLPDGLVSLIKRTLPAAVAAEVQAVWESPLSLRDRLEALFRRALRHHAFVLVLDNVETLLGADNTFRPEFADLQTFLEVLLEFGSGVRVITTSRGSVRFPAEVSGRLGERQLELTLSDGLGEHEAVALLRDLDSDGQQGVRDADDRTLREVARLCHGVPRVLETLVGTLRQRRTWTLPRVREEPGALAHLVENSSRELYESLSEDEKRVVEVLAVYDRAVSVRAVRALLPNLDGDEIFDALAENYVVLYGGRGRFSLHPLDQAYAYRQILKRGGDALRVQLHMQAAAFFRSLRKPDDENKALEDLWPQLQEFDQLLRAGRGDEACSLLPHYSDLCLKPWGHAMLVTELHGRLGGKVEDKRVRALGVANLSGAYAELGDLGSALESGEEALSLYRETGWLEKEARLVSSLGALHMQMGALEKGSGYIERGLELSRQLDDRRGEMIALTNLAACLELKKELLEAARSAEAALSLARALPAPEMEAQLLNILGVICGELGRGDRALAYLNEAAAASERLGDRPAQGSVQDSLRTVYLARGEFREAEAHFKRALAIADEISDRWLAATARKNLGLTQHRLGRSEQGLRTLWVALAGLHDLGETLGEGTALSATGSVHYDLGNVETAAALWLVAHDLLLAHGSPEQERVAQQLRKLRRSRKRLEQLLKTLPLRGDELVRNATGQAYGYFERLAERSPEAL